MPNYASCLKNGPTPASFCLFSFFFQHKFYRKNCRRQWDSNVGVEGEHADHVTTTTSLLVRLLLPPVTFTILDNFPLVELQCFSFQVIPVISSLTPVTTAVPLIGVLSLTAIKDAYDDIVSPITFQLNNYWLQRVSCFRYLAEWECLRLPKSSPDLWQKQGQDWS